MKTMQAALVVRHGGPEVLECREVPVPSPAAGEVLLRVRATSLNYHDIFTRRGMPGIRIPMPMIIGIDFAGDVVALGEGVEGFREGDRVLVDPVDRVGRGGLIGEVRPGGLAQYCCVPAHHLVALPQDVSYETAACLPVAYGTAHRMMTTIGRVAAGERVLVLGAAGGVGTGCVQLARLAGAEVIACASTAAKLDRLHALGAAHLLDYTREPIDQWVHAKFGKPFRRSSEGGVDVVVNFTGGDTWVQTLKCLRRQGRLLTCGATAGYAPPEDIRYIWTFELQILGSNSWQRDDIEALLALCRQGGLQPVVDGRFALHEAAAAMERLESRQAFGKVLVLP